MLLPLPFSASLNNSFRSFANSKNNYSSSIYSSFRLPIILDSSAIKFLLSLLVIISSIWLSWSTGWLNGFMFLADGNISSLTPCFEVVLFLDSSYCSFPVEVFGSWVFFFLLTFLSYISSLSLSFSLTFLWWRYLITLSLILCFLKWMLDSFIFFLER